MSAKKRKRSQRRGTPAPGPSAKPSREGPPKKPTRTTGPATSPLRRTGLGAALAAVLAVVVYLGALDNPFAYDDKRTVLENPSLRDPGNIEALLLYERFRPLVNLTYAVDYAFWELRPRGYHLTNLALHVAFVLLFFVVARTAIADARGRRDSSHRGAASEPPDPGILAGTAALLLAVHPMMSETVGYVSGRSEALCGAFVLASLLAFRAWMLRAGAGRLAAALALFGLAATSKEVGAMVPFLVALYDVLLVGGEGLRRRMTRVYAPLLGLVTLGGAWRIWSFVGIEDPNVPRAVWQNVMSQWEIIWRYLGLLILPVRQSLIHPTQRVESPWDPAALAAGLGLLGLAAAAWWVRRRAPLVTLAVGWFLLLLAPSSTFVPLNELMAEHRVYAASGGFFLAVAWGLGVLWSRLDAGSMLRRAMPIALAGVVLALSWATIERNRVWADTLTLWQDTAEKAPLTWRAVIGLAQAQRDAGDCETAARNYLRAAELATDDASAPMNAGICLAQLQRFPEAYAALEEAVRRDPHLGKTYTNLGRLAMILGRYDEAQNHLRRALEEEPESVAARFNLVQLYRRTGRPAKEILQICHEALGLDPTAAWASECISRLQNG